MGRGNRGRGRSDHPEEEEEMYEEEMEVSAQVSDLLPENHGGMRIFFFTIWMPVFEGEWAVLHPCSLKALILLVCSTAIMRSPWVMTSTMTTRKS